MKKKISEPIKFFTDEMHKNIFVFQDRHSDKNTRYSKPSYNPVSVKVTNKGIRLISK